MCPLVHVVEDDDALRNSLTLLLEASGYTTQGFASAATFLEAHQVRPSQCLLVDHNMPIISGLELLALLRFDGFDQPAFLISTDLAHPPSTVLIQMKADVLHVPIAPRVLLKAIAHVTGVPPANHN